MRQVSYGSSVEQHLVRIASNQHGLISRWQALGSGMSPSAIDRRLRSGRWLRLDVGVYAIAGAPATWEQRVLVAVLASGGIASHRCAAALWGIDGFARNRPELIVPVGSGFRRPGVLVHESVDFDRADERRRSGIAVTGPVRTAIDLGTRVSPRRHAHAIDDVIRRQLAAWPDIYDWVILLSARGRNGVGVTRTILEERYGDAIPDSAWNRNVQRLLADSGLPVPVAEHRIEDLRGRFIGRVDLAYPELRIAIELQSKQWHLNEAGFERDPLRRNKLQAAGWIVLEYTWRFYVDHPLAIVAEVRRVREARAAELGITP